LNKRVRPRTAAVDASSVVVAVLVFVLLRDLDVLVRQLSAVVVPDQS
jgi:hypothetical protein